MSSKTVPGTKVSRRCPLPERVPKRIVVTAQAVVTNTLEDMNSTFLRTYEHTSLPQDSNLLFICLNGFTIEGMHYPLLNVVSSLELFNNINIRILRVYLHDM